ncbi:GNAT family N-acetyltransferase [Aliivibrio fischeri]|uniref:bifunctional GNAT family N-acetyltransferase/hotdog fold thioesterase n=1 Tax=Aliivibrio fischeri TaxID=668 RepID=UPI0012D8F3F1|nr:bifunctional GNAT family N-acetyltransferase/hotdog fold thioesterase [Aliivibrio fischeri]MUK61424.1 GNAT family N-acetyltransferase [Aliivibrio fischeri]MUK67895.1 GNAT family N-acetyltransferase [Aliivibrio fischeri]MUK72842.1 GNAT family N-acetyltransferase [Aliivibrio fischeri]MUK77118.1 GNAT family N-acetyltransferase [Aliivibrio fischeri]MUL19387.1 GNAT family N-acetyltransferase [Aliivibrio fischeri]
MFRLITPTTEAELKAYYHFRWKILREPWRQPEGSERDAYDDMSQHRMILDGRDQPVAIGRLYLTPDNDGQIRYMAVAPHCRGKGIGALIMVALESYARQENAKRLVCNAREDAIPFYVRNGFTSQGELSDERGPVRHQQMLKHLDPLADVLRRPDWCSELQKRWENEIPISDKMGIKITQYTGYRFEVSAILNANLNPHNSMFAGSIFTMGTLTAWGIVWLLLKERGLDTTSIMLVDSHIRYRQPIVDNPKGITSLNCLEGDFDRLQSGKRARVKVKVDLCNGDNPAAEFTGTFMLMRD